MADIAIHQKEGNVSLRDISARQEISVKYLEQVVSLLTRSELLITSRGAMGGYRLKKNPEDYTVGEILRVAEGDIAPVACLSEGAPECPRKAECITLPVWQGLEKVIYAYLDGITLANVLQQSGIDCIE